MEGFTKLGNWLAQKFTGPDMDSMSLAQLETQTPRDLAEYILRLRRSLDLKTRELDRTYRGVMDILCKLPPSKKK